MVTEYLGREGYSVCSAHDGRNGLSRAINELFDLVLLDGMLPVLDGFDVLCELRRHKTTPVIMLTARSQERDRIRGLNVGADDYLPKPFNPEELLARIRAVLRRYKHASLIQAEWLRVGHLEINPATRVVRHLGEPILLTETEFRILELLIRSAGTIVTRDEIAVVLYQRKATPYERSLDVHMSHLRNKIKHHSEALIHTVRNEGYIIGSDGE